MPSLAARHARSVSACRCSWASKFGGCCAATVVANRNNEAMRQWGNEAILLDLIVPVPHSPGPQPPEHAAGEESVNQTVDVRFERRRPFALVPDRILPQRESVADE